jgi:hypothetical protein
MLNRSARRRLSLALKRRRQQFDAAESKKKGESKPSNLRSPTFYKSSAIRMVARATRAKKTNYQTENAQHGSNEASLAKSTRTIATFTKVLAFIGLLSALVSGLQWREMNSSGTQADKLIEANGRLAAAAQQSADISDKNLVATQRAWVGSIDANIASGSIGTSIKGTVLYVNSGREPARFQADVSEFVYRRNDWADGRVATIDFFKDECLSKESIVGQRFAWPTTGFTSYSAHAPNVSIPQIGIATWSDDIINGEAIMTLQGCFIYEAFGNVHHTAFCYFYDSKISDMQHLNICPIGNGVN